MTILGILGFLVTFGVLCLFLIFFGVIGFASIILSGLLFVLEWGIKIGIIYLIVKALVKFVFIVFRF